MRRILLPIMLATLLSACSGTGALKAATEVLTPSKGPEITVQAGAENTKQHLGLVSKVDESVSVKENSGSVTVKAEKRPQSLQSESVQADSITFNQLEIWPLAVAFLGGLLPTLAILFWTLPRPKWCRKEEADA